MTESTTPASWLGSGQRWSAVSRVVSPQHGRFAHGYNVPANFSDVLVGVWGTAMRSLLPVFLLLAWLLRRTAPSTDVWMPAQLIRFGIFLPWVAGMDPIRQNLRLNFCGLGLLGFVACC